MATATEKKPRTEAQQAHAARLAQMAKDKAVAAKQAPAAVVMEGEALDSEDDVLALLGQAAKAFGEAKGKRSEQVKLATQIAEMIDKLDFAAYPDLLQSDSIMKLIEAVNERRAPPPNFKDLPPGSTITKGPFVEDLKQWTWNDIREDGGVYMAGYGGPMPWVDYTPRGLPLGKAYVGWQGLSFIFVNDETVHVPKCFVDVLEDSYKRIKLAGEHAQLLFKGRNTISDPNMLDDATLRVRSGMTGGSVSAMVSQQWQADPFLVELDGKMSGEEPGEGDEGAA